MGRRPCCDKIGLKKGPWTGDEDQKLRNFIQTNGTQFCWRSVPQQAGLVRCGKSCRLRWTNYLRPGLKNDLLSEQDEKLVIHLHSQFGNKWSKIASHLPGRTDNYIKNYWHNHIKKKLRNMEIDSLTDHRPLLTHPPTDDHHNISRKKSRKSRAKMHDEDKDKENDDETSLSVNNLDYLAVGSLTTDTGFSVDEIPLIQPHEILIQPACDHLSSHNCSPSSSSLPSSPSTSTRDISSSHINLMNEKLKCLQYWHSNDPCKDYNVIIRFSDEGDFTDWDWLPEPARQLAIESNMAP
ncbi:hypothetical protein AgCh_019713 [Apium graveolens]